VRGLFAVAFPLVVLAAWCGSLEWKTRSGEEIRLEIEGYDPRDLLSGHYLTFRFSFSNKVRCASSSSQEVKRCVCLSPQGSDSVLYSAAGDHDCDAGALPCATMIRGWCQGSRFVTGLERYYIPEELSPALAVVPPESSASVSLARDGSGVVTGVYVKNERIEEYAQRMLLSPDKE
jgi:uncharacterized membrane-anchored protein